ncbi:MAG: 4Fe-4S cluster-binding domain-containing protein [Bacteroides sp.]|nr:4Fe-4S cluster-binding domain-containing protein [Bacteroides sp.]
MITTSPKYRTTRICSLMVTHGCNLNCVYCFEKHKELGLRMMSFETAKDILSREFNLFEVKERNPEERLAIEFFGGEPLVNFKLIKRIYEWVKELNLSFPLMFQTTTNGTLFNTQILEWFTAAKDDFRVVVSIDGDDIMQMANRGVSAKEIPTEYILHYWPNSYFKMTVSKDTLPNYAQGIIDLTRKGYRVPSSLAEGVDWSKEDEAIYRRELLKIGSFYLDNPQYRPDQPFDLPFDKLLHESAVPPKNCGVGTNTQIYDTDGKAYPCHLFLPIVHGREGIEAIMNSIDFTDDASLINDECMKCPIVKLCRTCYGYNQLDRGDVKARNKTKCKMLLAELQVISSFQVQYFMQRKGSLSTDDLGKLSTAMKGYELVHGECFLFQ